MSRRMGRVGGIVSAGLGLLMALAVAHPATAGLLPPVAVNDSASTRQDRLLTVAAPGVLANDLQLGGGYTARLVSGTGHGTVSLASNGGYTYQPNSGFAGSDSFRYKVDGGLLGLSNTATVTITVIAATPAPTSTPTPAPTPPPTPAPTPKPTPAPTPTPTAGPTATPRPSPSTAPLPSLPLPTVGPLPTPIPSLVPIPTIVPTARPTSSTAPTATPRSSAPGGPSAAPSATPSPAPASVGPAVAAGGPAGSGGPTGSGGPPTPGGGGPAVDRFRIPAAAFDPINDVGVSVFGGFEWAVPAFSLAVPGLLLIFAVLAQTMAAAIWLPAVRRWLGAFGLNRRRRQSA